MIKTLSDEDRKRINGLVVEVEKQTNTQIVLALIQRSDVYAEIPWKAFALGASITGLIVLIWELLNYAWDPLITVLVAVVTMLGGGAFLATVTLLLHPFARVFLSDERSEVEVYQYAESLFLSRELFATTDRTGILMLVSLFERKVVILPDKGLGERLTKDAAQSIIHHMTLHLRKGEASRAFEVGLVKISGILGISKEKTGDNELPDDIIEEKGV